MSILNKLSRKQKILLKDRIFSKVSKYRSWEFVRLHTRLMILHARIMMELPMWNYASCNSIGWITIIGEWRKKLKDPYYIMNCND